MSGFGKRNRPVADFDRSITLPGFSSGPATAVAFPDIEAYRTPPMTEASWQRGSGGRSMFMAYLLWLFFGNLGAHRIYVGRHASALGLAALSIVGWLLMIVYFLGLIILVPVWLFVLIDAFRIPRWVRGY
jgi:TM2 domain-containing membrane protein YozV